MRSLIVMAHNLGLEVIAEGVETRSQAGSCATSVAEAQGYLYAKPLPAAGSGYLRTRRLLQAVGAESPAHEDVYLHSQASTQRAGERHGLNPWSGRSRLRWASLRNSAS